MDFHTMVSNFKRGVLSEGNNEELAELTKRSRKIVRKYISDGTPGRHQPRFSFNELFGGDKDMRVAIPLEDDVGFFATQMFKRITTELGWAPAFRKKKVTQKRRRAADEGGGEYEVEIEIPDLQMTKTERRTIPKGPRKGEVIERQVKTTLGQIVQKSGTPEEKEWWKEHQNSLREMTNAQNWFLKPWMADFERSSVQKPVIIISRHPIDVARMSDFSMTRSCHTEGRSHFQCALAESKGHGMVAYLVKREDWEKWNLEERLQAEEVFGDPEIGLEGPSPIGRVRLRKLYSQEFDDEFAVVEDRVYGVDMPDFLPTVRKWARDGQKDSWQNEEGELEIDALSDTDWILVGGDYLDTQIDEQLELMFQGTEYEEAAEAFSSMTYRHEDYFDEAGDTAYAEAEQRLERMEQEYGNRAQDISIGVDIEEGWDDMPFVASCSMNATFEFDLPEEWSEDPRAIEIPNYNDSWQMIREVKREIENIIDDVTYQPENLEIETDDSQGWITIRIYASYTSSDLDEIDSQLYTYTEYIDEKHDEIEKALLVWLKTEGYLPPSQISSAFEQFEGMQFENIEVLYDEDDPGDGLLIKNKGRVGIPFGKYRYTDPLTGVQVFPELWKELTSTQLGAQAATAARIRRVLRRAHKQSIRAAAKQLDLPGIPPAEVDFVLPLPRNLQFKFEVLTSSKGNFQMSGGSRVTDPAIRAKMARTMDVDLGYHFALEVPYDAKPEVLQVLKNFAVYIDENIDDITAAVKDIVDKEWREIASVLNKPATPTASLNETKIRNAIRNAIKKKLMEQTGFETRLFQVNLRLSIDKGQGGGIEQKLNRIRAISGVTVVSHQDGDSIRGKETIEAKIKFHPEKDSEQGISYVRKTLIPDINSSRHVPGVKVVQSIPNSFKRIDK